MLRIKTLAISVVVLGVLLFGAVVAYAGWSWNAKADIEGTTISRAWSVANGGKAQYNAEITISVPANASIDVVEIAPNESVTVVHTNRRCSGGVIDTTASWVISGSGHGQDVSVAINEVGGANQNYGSASGSVGSSVSVNAAIAGTCRG